MDSIALSHPESRSPFPPPLSDTKEKIKRVRRFIGASGNGNRGDRMVEEEVEAEEREEAFLPVSSFQNDI